MRNAWLNAVTSTTRGGIEMRGRMNRRRRRRRMERMGGEYVDDGRQDWWSERARSGVLRGETAPEETVPAWLGWL